MSFGAPQHLVARDARSSVKEQQHKPEELRNQKSGPNDGETTLTQALKVLLDDNIIEDQLDKELAQEAVQIFRQTGRLHVDDCFST